MTWPSVARLDPATKMLRFFDSNGKMVYESFPMSNSKDLLSNFGLAFIGVTESTVDFESKTQRITAKMRAINLDTHEALHGDNWGYDE
jgi:hypothetical protein